MLRVRREAVAAEAAERAAAARGAAAAAAFQLEQEAALEARQLDLASREAEAQQSAGSWQAKRRALLRPPSPCVLCCVAVCRPGVQAP
jgi:hypothetical protein